jgi:hypothetical protein
MCHAPPGPLHSQTEKFVFEFAGPYEEGAGSAPAGCESEGELMRVNDRIHQSLNCCKNHITKYHQNRKWDHYKRLTNEYELVFTSSSEFPGVGSLSPISRSFFKLWEVLHDFREEGLWCRPRALCAMFLAEGPGGFVESFARFRDSLSRGAAACARKRPADELHGMTLLTKNRSVPSWKVHGRGADLRVHRGVDGTGDMYSLANVDRVVADVGPGRCDLVTADGGFDFSGDFNNQESASMRLILSEVYMALRLQRARGSFVLKVYDLHSTATMRLLYGLRRCYSRLRVVKPLTSRPANSEKYVLCTGFVGAPPDLLAALRTAFTCLDAAMALPLPVSFIRDVVEFNTVYVARQVSYIARTILLIQEDPDGRRLHATRIRCQLDRSIRWCYKYRIRLSASALARYKKMVSGP